MDHGTSPNLDGLSGSKEEDSLRVIVSLSHAGEVKGDAEEAFKPRKVKITPAGGL